MANALDTVMSLFPWLNQIGIAPALLQGWAAQYGDNSAAIYAEVQKTSGYQTMFAGIRRPDGTMRHNEATHLARRDDYRTLLRQYGRPDYEYDDPQDFVAFYEQEIDPNELKERFETMDQIKLGSNDVRDAFYVYAGIRLNDDDLYMAAVNPTDRQRLIDEYNTRVARQPLDYGTWITRATEAGLDRVTRLLGDLKSQGLVTGQALQSVTGLDPEFARQMVDQLYHGGSAEGPFLSLSQLMHSFDFAMIGGAARASGMELPSVERVAALRQAGVTRAKALETYGLISRKAGEFQGALDRSNLGVRFGTEDFEKALFLQSAPESSLLEQAVAGEKARGESTGTAGFSQSRTGNLQQRGLGLL